MIYVLLEGQSWHTGGLAACSDLRHFLMPRSHCGDCVHLLSPVHSVAIVYISYAPFTLWWLCASLMPRSHCGDCVHLLCPIHIVVIVCISYAPFTLWRLCTSLMPRSLCGDCMHLLCPIRIWAIGLMIAGNLKFHNRPWFTVPCDCKFIVVNLFQSSLLLVNRCHFSSLTATCCHS